MKFLIYKYIAIGKKISTSQSSQQIVDMQAQSQATWNSYGFLTPRYIIITVLRDGGRYTASVHVIYIENNLAYVYLL